MTSVNTLKLLPLKLEDDQREELISNIISVYRQATPAQRARGRTWYRTANDVARIIGADVTVGAGLLAVLSAQRQWFQAIKLAQHAARNFDVALTGKQLATMHDQEDKIRRIMSGENPLEVLPEGLKTWNFYLCIVDPKHPTAVVIDRHAHDLARGRPFGDKPRGLSAHGRYEALAEAYRQAAKRLKRLPSEVQAVTWVVWTEWLDSINRSHRGFSG